MRIKMAHVREQGINFAVFDADSRCHTDSGRHELLNELTVRARNSGLRIEKAALAFREGHGVKFYGTPDLVSFLSKRGVPSWTHILDV